MAKTTSCAVTSCTNDRAPGSSWCALHAELFKSVGRPTVEPAETAPRVPGYLPRTPPETPAGARLVSAAEAAPAAVALVAGQWPANGHRRKTTCAEPGCDEPRWSSENQQYPRCETHQREKWVKVAAARRRANGVPEGAPRGRRKPAAETPAEPVEAAPVFASSPDALPLPYDEPVTLAIAPAEPIETAVQAAAEQLPDLLRQLIRQALQSANPALKVSVTGLKVSFAAELDIPL